MERRSRPLAALPGGLLLVLLLATGVLASQSALAQPRAAVGDPLPRIQCPPGYTARVYAQGLRSPDGLAISPAGTLHVAEEQAGRVSRIDAAGNVTPVLTGLNSPEGIAFDPQSGALYVVEDVEGGRLIQRTAGGTTSTLARGLEAPEGVTWTPGGTLYLTESNVQYAEAQEIRTRVAAYARPATLTRVITDTPVLEIPLVHAWSYAGIAAGPDGLLYVANELSGVEITRPVEIAPGVIATLTLTTTDSVLRVDPAAGTRALFTSGLHQPEGLGFSPGGGFPLYVAEEDVGEGRGRVTAIGAGGEATPFCSGFQTIEDVVVDERGTLYVSEDGSGLVIEIVPDEPLPDPPQASFVAAPRRGIAPLAVAFSDTSSGSYQTRLWDLGDGQTSSLGHPTHVYRSPGSYSVSLTIAGPAGSDSQTETGYIQVYWGQYLPFVFRPM